jgi:3-oxoacyl-(acyl-carrier-protein) synthase
MGAAGIVEITAAIFCMQHGQLHPNLNLDRPDPACPLRLTGVESLNVPLRICMKNSYAFGGSNATLIVAKYVE